MVHAYFQQIGSLRNPSINHQKSNKESKWCQLWPLYHFIWKYSSVVPWPFCLEFGFSSPSSVCLQTQPLWETKINKSFPLCMLVISNDVIIWNLSPSFSPFNIYSGDLLFSLFSRLQGFPLIDHLTVEHFSYSPCSTSWAIILKCSGSCFKLKTVQSFSFFFLAVLDLLHENLNSIFKSKYC